MSEWGFSAPSFEGWLSDAEAGMERRIGSDSGIEIEKDPWAYEYLQRLDPAELRSYDALIIPIRSRLDAALSRSVQERLARALANDTDQWEWNSWGSVGGGAVSDTSVEGIQHVLEAGLWDLLEVAARAGVQPILVAFPRMAQDFDYLWAQLGTVVSGRISEADARSVFDRIADPSKLHIEAADDDGSMKVRELTALVNVLRKKVQSAEARVGAGHAQIAELQARVAPLVAERDALAAEVGDLHEHLRELLASRSWRYTAWLRR
jgi:polyhydroxyalkanoate synthesis regulator phasin